MDDIKVNEFDATGEPDEEPRASAQFDEPDDEPDGDDDVDAPDADEDDDEGIETGDDEAADDDEDDVEAAEEEPDDEDDDEPDDEAEEEPDDEPDDDLDETDFATVATGGSLEEAKRNAVQQLRKLVPLVAETDIEFEVVDEAVKGGFLGRGRVRARVEARVRPAAVVAAPLAEEALPPVAGELKVFLEEAVQLMGLSATVTVTETADTTVAEIGGDDLGLLIGRHGQTIDALQYLSAIVVNRRRKSRRQVIVDAEGYRERRTSSLHMLADRVAQRVAREHEPVTLKPMTAAERKVVHIHLKDHPRVETVSEGQEPHRAVVIVPRRKA
jgi:spoIIIJ-associated protein